MRVYGYTRVHVSVYGLWGSEHLWGVSSRLLASEPCTFTHWVTSLTYKVVLDPLELSYSCDLNSSSARADGVLSGRAISLGHHFAPGDWTWYLINAKWALCSPVLTPTSQLNSRSIFLLSLEKLTVRLFFFLESLPWYFLILYIFCAMICEIQGNSVSFHFKRNC